MAGSEEGRAFLEHGDWTARVPDELLLYAFNYLEHGHLLTLSSVCKRWNRLAQDGHLWRNICRQKCWPLVVPFDPEDPSEWRELYRRCIVGKPTRKTLRNVVARGLTASSTDYPDQGIENTVKKSDAVNDALRSYWSSRGSDDSKSSERLTYILSHPVCVLYSVGLRSFQAYWQEGRPIYAPCGVRFLFGLAPEQVHAVFEVAVCPKVNSLVRWKLPGPVIANWVAVELIGRTQTQPVDDRYYTALSYVECLGIPLSDIDNRTVSASAVRWSWPRLSPAYAEHLPSRWQSKWPLMLGAAPSEALQTLLDIPVNEGAISVADAEDVMSDSLVLTGGLLFQLLNQANMSPGRSSASTSGGGPSGYPRTGGPDPWDVPDSEEDEEEADV